MLDLLVSCDDGVENRWHFRYNKVLPTGYNPAPRHDNFSMVVYEAGDIPR